MHYLRQRAHGDVGRAEPLLLRDVAVCIVPECGRAHHAMGLCVGHNQRWRRKGIVGGPLGKRLPWPENLIMRLRFEDNGCVTFTGSRTPGGYGHLQKDGAVDYAHRLSYEMFIGPIPEGHTLDHDCHTRDLNCAGGPTCPHRACVHPAHLVPMTMNENLERGRGFSPNLTRTEI